MLFEVLDSDGPALLLVQVIVDLLTSVESDRSCVQRILGDGNHYTLSKILEKHLEGHVHSLAGSIEKEYVIDIRASRQAVSLLDEIGNRLSCKAESQTVGVPSEVSWNLIQISLDSLGDIRVIDFLKQVRREGSSEDVSVEGDGLLTEN